MFFGNALSSDIAVFPPLKSPRSPHSLQLHAESREKKRRKPPPEQKKQEHAEPFSLIDFKSLFNQPF